MKIDDISLIKGIHPGIILARELNKRNLQIAPFALSIDESPNNIQDITNCQKGMEADLALRIEKALNIDQGFFMALQSYYDNAPAKTNQAAPDLSKFRKTLFWDTDIETIDWLNQKKAVINRVFDRGSESEKMEVTRFYGQQIIDEILQRKH